MPGPAPISVSTPNVLDLKFITVSVRTDFRRKKDDGTITFDWHTEIIAKAKVELHGANGGDALDTALTDARGLAVLETSELVDGNYTVRITPENSREALAGPDIADHESDPLPDRMYHPLDVTIKLSQGQIESATIDAKVRYAGVGNRLQSKWPPDAIPTDHLPIDLKPIWMRAPRVATAAARQAAQIQMIVIHNTGADSVPVATIGPDLNTFIGGGSEIHYAMDLNGHVIKFMRDLTVVWHAGGRWKGKDPNDVSIGIEVVHKEAGVHEYTDEQYSALPEFLESISRAYSIDHTQMVGHSDVGTHILAVAKVAALVDVDLLDGSRDQDPGQVFRWEKLERLGWGMVPGTVALGDAYGGLFGLVETVVLRTGDHDAKAASPGHPAIKGHFDGKDRTDIAGTPIKDLQSDLAAIGYSLHVNGSFDKYTHLAVAAFQRHFFSGDRRRAADGKVDRDTAQMIKNVKGA